MEGSPHHRYRPVTNPKPLRTRWKIALGVVVLFAAVGWLAADRQSKRHRAIQEIERVGGVVIREETGPKWLRRWGIVFDRVVMVTLAGTKISDDGLKHLNLSNLTNLQRLWLDGTEISDEGLKNLGGLKNLEQLSLVDTNVTEDGVKMLQESLPNCQIEWK